METIRRAILIVLDGVGAGEAPDAAAYGDEGSHTLRNTSLAVGGLALPNLQRLGLGNVTEIAGVPPAEQPAAAYGRMRERSAGKDTTTGHWELAGIILDRPFPTYPNGFPPELIRALEERIGRRVLGNRAASGTEIIAELGEEHLRTGAPIVYTSADSVCQIAAHEDVIPVDTLYAYCREARALFQGEHAVGRIIARPFAGEPGNFRRTERRKDFSLPPPSGTLLDRLQAAGIAVETVGKLHDIFAGRGISRSFPSRDNTDGIRLILERMHDPTPRRFIFANLLDFDSLYGHRNDPFGFAAALAEFDAAVPRLESALRPGDLLVITADHGNDPTTPSTDHSRELVPLLVLGAAHLSGVDLGTRDTYADVAATLLDAFGLPAGPHGTSFWSPAAT